MKCRCFCFCFHQTGKNVTSASNVTVFLLLSLMCVFLQDPVWTWTRTSWPLSTKTLTSTTPTTSWTTTSSPRPTARAQQDTWGKKWSCVFISFRALYCILNVMCLFIILFLDSWIFLLKPFTHNINSSFPRLPASFTPKIYYVIKQLLYVEPCLGSLDTYKVPQWLFHDVIWYTEVNQHFLSLLGH